MHITDLKIKWDERNRIASFLFFDFVVIKDNLGIDGYIIKSVDESQFNTEFFETFKAIYLEDKKAKAEQIILEFMINQLKQIHEGE